MLVIGGIFLSSYSLPAYPQKFNELLKKHTVNELAEKYENNSKDRKFITNEFSIFSIHKEKDSRLDIVGLENGMRIDNSNPNQSFSRNNYHYKIIDQYNKTFEFTSNDIFPKTTYIEIKGAIKIYKNNFLVFDTSSDLNENFSYCNIKSGDTQSSINSNDRLSGVGLPGSYWPAGFTIKVSFFNNTVPKWAQKEIIEGAREWEKHINLKFDFVDPSQDPHITIENINIPLVSALGFMIGGESSIGTEALKVPQSQSTMRLNSFHNPYTSTKKKRMGTILHELGHALGLKHEQEHVESRENKCKLIFYYLSKKYKLSEAIEKTEEFFYNGRFSYDYSKNYDPKSIMHYPLKPLSIGYNTELSPGDIAFIKEKYPF